MFMGLIAAGIAHAHPDLAPKAITERWLRAVPGTEGPAANPSEGGGRPVSAAGR
jgi:hypothetical protein